MQEPAAQTSDGHRTLEQRAPERGRNRFERPKVAVDTVIFVIDEGRLKTYLVQLKGGPLRGKWAFPGGLVRVGELLDDAANRELASTTGLTCAYLEQLFTFGDPSRDPRSHVVSVAYMALIPDPARIVAPSSKYAAGGWFDVASQLPPLAYDHMQMANYALSRLKAKLEYTNIRRRSCCRSRSPSRNWKTCTARFWGAAWIGAISTAGYFRWICSRNRPRSAAVPTVLRRCTVFKDIARRSCKCCKLVYSRQGKP